MRWSVANLRVFKGNYYLLFQMTDAQLEGLESAVAAVASSEAVGIMPPVPSLDAIISSYKGRRVSGDEMMGIMKDYNSGIMVNEISANRHASKSTIYRVLHYLEAGKVTIKWRGRRKEKPAYPASAINQAAAIGAGIPPFLLMEEPEKAAPIPYAPPDKPEQAVSAPSVKPLPGFLFLEEEPHEGHAYAWRELYAAVHSMVEENMAEITSRIESVRNRKLRASFESHLETLMRFAGEQALADMYGHYFDRSLVKPETARASLRELKNLSSLPQGAQITVWNGVRYYSGLFDMVSDLWNSIKDSFTRPLLVKPGRVYA